MRGPTCRRFAAFLATVVLAACAGAPRGTEEPSTGRQDSAVLSRSDLAPHDELTAFEAVRRFRPRWLRTRGTGVLVAREREAIRVYLDGVLYGDLPALQNLNARDLEEIRFLDSREATTRFGTGHTVGAIALTSRR